MMRQVYETKPYSDSRMVVYYLIQGFKICRKCNVMIKCNLHNCPDCGRSLASTPRTAKAKRHYREVLAGKRPVLVPTAVRHCSRCDTTDAGSYWTHANSKKINHWAFSKITGARLCKTCKRLEFKELRAKEMQARRCAECGTDKSGLCQKGYTYWNRDGKGGVLCNACGTRKRRRLHRSILNT